MNLPPSPFAQEKHLLAQQSVRVLSGELVDPELRGLRARNIGAKVRKRKERNRRLREMGEASG